LASGLVHDQELKLLPLFVDPTLLAIDVGGHVGGYTHSLLKLGCRVMTFEANSTLAHNLQRMYGREADIVWSAVSSTSGWTTLRIPQESGIATVEHLNDLNGMAVARVEVPCVTLDEKVTEPVGFIKVDVEGHELAVLQGAKGILQRDHPVILIEAEERHRRNAVQSIINQLSPLGYCGFMIDGGRLVGISHFDVNRDQTAPPHAIGDLNAGLYTGRYISNFLFICS
jgi:FkbM family methyltransferase